MAQKKTLINLLVDNNISFNFNRNEKGESEYVNDFFTIDENNADKFAKTGNFSGITIYNFTPENIANFEKVYNNSKIWNYLIPIIEISLSDFNEKQLYGLLGIIGSELEVLYLNYSKLDKLDIGAILKFCPKLNNLELADQNWGRENRIPINISKIGKQFFKKIQCRNFALNGESDWSKLNIDSLILDECDTSKIVFPTKLSSLDCTSTNDSVYLKGANNLKELYLTINNNSAQKIDLTNLNNLLFLDLKILFGDNIEIKLPKSLVELSISTSEATNCSLKFLDSLNNLESLKIDAGNKSFNNYEAIGSLNKLKIFKLDINDFSQNKIKNNFKIDHLKNLKLIEEITLKHHVDLSDFIFVKDVPSLKSIEIEASKIKSIKGLEFGNIQILRLIDCHSISDLKPILKSDIKEFEFIITDLYASKIEITTKEINQLAESNIQEAKIVLNKIKFIKKDLKPLEKVYDLILEYDTLYLTLK